MATEAYYLELRGEGFDEHHHYLDDSPVHAGDTLELLLGGNWIPGRYEWTSDPDTSPTFHTDDGVVGLGPESRLRWPMKQNKG